MQGANGEKSFCTVWRTAGYCMPRTQRVGAVRMSGGVRGLRWAYGSPFPTRLYLVFLISVSVFIHSSLAVVENKFAA